MRHDTLGISRSPLHSLIHSSVRLPLFSQSSRAVITPFFCQSLHLIRAHFCCSAQPKPVLASCKVTQAHDFWPAGYFSPTQNTLSVYVATTFKFQLTLTTRSHAQSRKKEIKVDKIKNVKFFLKKKSAF